MLPIDVKKLSVSLLGPFFAGWIGSLATMPAIPTWYDALEKPFFNPPNWVFAPVWTTLYLLMGIALYLVWTRDTSKRAKKKGLLFFWIQLVCNLLWSLVFFGLKSTGAGVIVISILLFYIWLTMKNFKEISRISFLLMIPYILWVSFATILTISIYLLN